MCYSAMIEADLRKLEKLFGAKVDWDSFDEAFDIRDQYPGASIPLAIDTYIIQNAQTVQQKRMARKAKAHYKAEIERVTEKLKKYEQDVKDFEAKLKAGSKMKDLAEKLEKRRATVQRHIEKIENCKKIEQVGAPRIFPNFYAPVLMQEKKNLWIRFMRYHLCPKNGVELSTYKYNLFNARKDRLLESRIWKSLFGKQHGIFPFYRFYESVEGKNGESKIIYFEPETEEIMWAASLVETASVKAGTLRSFAAITSDPPEEVAAAGHDRCPVFLSKTYFDEWLSPQKSSKDQLLDILNSVVPTYYKHSAA